MYWHNIYAHTLTISTKQNVSMLMFINGLFQILFSDHPN